MQPLFNAGALWANYKASKAQREAAILSYQKSVQEAFRDVADSLIGYQKAREYRAQREIFATTLRNQLRLANMRYDGGVSSYLEVLDTERQALDAELTYAQAYLGELDSVIRCVQSPRRWLGAMNSSQTSSQCSEWQWFSHAERSQAWAGK